TARWFWKLCVRWKSRFVRRSRFFICNNLHITKSRTCWRCQSARLCRVCRAAKHCCVPDWRESPETKVFGIKSFALSQTEEINHMDNREAKFILNAYRPGGRDASDPRFSEALEQARRDPILQRWFDETVAFDTAIIDKLSAAPVPSDLRESILAGVKVSRVPRWKNRFGQFAVAA